MSDPRPLHVALVCRPRGLGLKAKASRLCQRVAETNQWEGLRRRGPGSEVFTPTEVAELAAKVEYDARFSTDPLVSPATLDLTHGDTDSWKNLCIYRIDGDQLTIGFGWAEADRPATFDSPKQTRETVFVLRRVKKE